CCRRSRRSPSWERTPRAFREPKAAPNLSTACAGNNIRQGPMTLPKLRNTTFSGLACIQQATSNDQLESGFRRGESPNQANRAMKTVNRSPHWTTDPARNPRPISRKSPFTKVELGNPVRAAVPDRPIFPNGFPQPEPAKTQLLSLLWP